MDDSRAEEILGFWLGDEEGFREAWFQKDEGFDREIRERFGEDYERAARGELDGWKASPRGSLALILLLDQFPRNMFRDHPRAYATDPLARDAADHAVASGFDRELAPVERMFIYMPFEHGESPDDQRRSVELFRALSREPGAPDVLYYALRHQEIIERFGRFPHRNEALGRTSTPEEIEYLTEPGAPF